MIEIAGPQRFHLDELARNTLRERRDPREVITDPHAPYYDAELHERTLVPAQGARLAETRFVDWLNQSATSNGLPAHGDRTLVADFPATAVHSHAAWPPAVERNTHVI